MILDFKQNGKMQEKNGLVFAEGAGRHFQLQDWNKDFEFKQRKKKKKK